MGEFVTRGEAASMLGVARSSVGRFIESGDLTRRPGRVHAQIPSLYRAEVVALVQRREQAARERSEALRKKRRRTPDDEHDWLTFRHAAALIGVSPRAVSKGARAGKIPHTVYRGRRWFRRDLTELFARARKARRTGELVD